MENNIPNQQYEIVGELVSIFQRGRRWYAHYRLHGKPVRQSLKTGNKKEARRKALAVEHDLINGEVRRPTQAPMIEDVVNEYIVHLRALRRSQKTITKYEFGFKLMLELAAKRRITRIDQIDLAFVDAFKLERTTHRVKPKNKDNNAKAKPKTTHNDVVLIKQLVNFAVRRRMIRENPLADLKLPQPKRTPQPFWTRDQVEEILKTASDKYRALFHFLADTETRIGEARWLTWTDVDLENKVVHIRAKEDWRPKSGDERVIHLSADLRTVLVELPRHSEWVFYGAANGSSSGCRPTSL